MRRFQLQRHEDPSGVSGTGVVAQGVQFDDGSCAMRWLSDTPSTVLYANVEDVVAVHGHEGRTRLIWLDQAPRVRQWKLEPTRVDTDRVRALGRRSEIIARLRRS